VLEEAAAQPLEKSPQNHRNFWGTAFANQIFAILERRSHCRSSTVTLVYRLPGGLVKGRSVKALVSTSVRDEKAEPSGRLIIFKILSAT
jgi:hypothetical protein